MKALVHETNRCDFCGVCVAVCPHDAIQLDEAKWQTVMGRCTRCGFCRSACPMDALEMVDEEPI